MTTISTAASATSATAGLAGASAAVASAATASADPSIGDRFLALLITQLKNQDPLNPMDNAQLTSQLAQISTVTGINKLNDTMTGIGLSLGSNQYLQAAGLVGHTVLVPGSKMELAAGAAAGGINLASDADHVVVSVSDASGRVIRKIDMGAQSAGTQSFAWDGQTDAGAAAPDGLYSFTVAATQGSATVSAAALMSGRVDGVVLASNGTTQLQLGRLGRVDLSQIIKIT